MTFTMPFGGGRLMHNCKHPHWKPCEYELKQSLWSDLKCSRSLKFLGVVNAASSYTPSEAMMEEFAVFYML